MLDPQARAASASLYAAYKDWCDFDGRTPYGNRRFTTALGKKFDKVGTGSKNARKRAYQGIGLASEIAPSDTADQYLPTHSTPGEK